MGWHGHLHLDYRRAGSRTLLHDRHEGPLRVLQSLYPEDPAICHNVLVHPPGGMVGGDAVHVDVRVGAAAHALVTTAGATRFYRTRGDAATQSVTACVDGDARLEWLPLETIAYSGCDAESRIRIELAEGGEAIGWDILALGLPASGQPFEAGRYRQSIELADRWLERGTIAASDRRLLESPLGLAGQRALGMLWFAAGGPIGAERRQRLLDAAREVAGADALRDRAGVTAPQAEVVVARVLGPSVEPVIGLLIRIWRAWRAEAWALPGIAPRVWRT